MLMYPLSNYHFYFYLDETLHLNQNLQFLHRNNRVKNLPLECFQVLGLYVL